ncbi:hypothetical protein IQ254_07610 [Nodosilinea sp. LEGE 07088]|uniref:hypothetical protein n=1 Tax=Nodosilinea sp. LEGE 07088 TaxID=2777968 RepID=UPI001881DC85|nr:hypothetical protein [Nodosilinea sp. LEGE 07088]MBE9137068.1 hypothetical protein [Nodosilinea sp. LEGE 07088]
MPDTNKTLKQENSLLIRAYVAANLIIFWALSTGTKLTEAFKTAEPSIDKIIESGTISLLICIFTVVICGQLSSDFKYILIFRRLKHTLPGHRAFSHYMQNDPRINQANLCYKFGDIPSDPIEQNRLWYKIYKKREEDKIVNDTHKNFLLLRELTGLSFLFLFVLGCSSLLVFSDHKTSLFYILALLTLFLCSSQAAQNYGTRLVTNVLAIESVAEE